MVLHARKVQREGVEAQQGTAAVANVNGIDRSNYYCSSRAAEPLEVDVISGCDGVSRPEGEQQ